MSCAEALALAKKVGGPRHSLIPRRHLVGRPQTIDEQAAAHRRRRIQERHHRPGRAVMAVSELLRLIVDADTSGAVRGINQLGAVSKRELSKSEQSIPDQCPRTRRIGDAPSIRRPHGIVAGPPASVSSCSLGASRTSIRRRPPNGIATACPRGHRTACHPEPRCRRREGERT